MPLRNYGENLNAFSDLDTNANGVLDNDDENVSPSMPAIPSSTSAARPTEHAEGTIKLVGVTGLDADDLSFS